MFLESILWKGVFDTVLTRVLHNSHLSLSTEEHISNVGHTAAANQLPAFNSTARGLKTFDIFITSFCHKMQSSKEMVKCCKGFLKKQKLLKQ